MKKKRAKKPSARPRKKPSKARGLFTYIYILQSVSTPSKSYVGVTNCVMRRIRQHNGEIIGGARYTRSYRPWRFFAIFRVNTRRDALSLEWNIKHRRAKSDGKGLKGIVNRAWRHGAKRPGFMCVSQA